MESVSAPTDRSRELSAMIRDVGTKGVSAMAYCILSCDGGGIRGLLPSMLIQRLSSDISAFLGNVSLFAGTSAGGLVSLGLASGVAVGDIVTLFQTKGSTIFTPFSSRMASPDVRKLQATLKARAAAAPTESWWEWVVEHLQMILNELLYVKYNNTGL